MPLYWFQLDLSEPSATITHRVQSLVGPEPKLSTKELFFGRGRRPEDPLFVGSVQQLSFSIQRYIVGRNSFLPMIRGRLTPIATGTRVTVRMFIHPASAVFMAFWLVFSGRAALVGHSPVAGLMFFVGIAMTTGFFFPEAIKGKRLLVAALNPSAAPHISATL